MCLETTRALAHRGVAAPSFLDFAHGHGVPGTSALTSRIDPVASTLLQSVWCMAPASSLALLFGQHVHPDRHRGWRSGPDRQSFREDLFLAPDRHTIWASLQWTTRRKSASGTLRRADLYGLVVPMARRAISDGRAVSQQQCKQTQTADEDHHAPARSERNGSGSRLPLAGITRPPLP